MQPEYNIYDLKQGNISQDHLKSIVHHIKNKIKDLNVDDNTRNGLISHLEQQQAVAIQTAEKEYEYKLHHAAPHLDTIHGGLPQKELNYRLNVSNLVAGIEALLETEAKIYQIHEEKMTQLLKDLETLKTQKAQADTQQANEQLEQHLLSMIALQEQQLAYIQSLAAQYQNILDQIEALEQLQAQIIEQYTNDIAEQLENIEIDGERIFDGLSDDNRKAATKALAEIILKKEIKLDQVDRAIKHEEDRLKKEQPTEWSPTAKSPPVRKSDKLEVLKRERVNINKSFLDDARHVMQHYDVKPLANLDDAALRDKLRKIEESPGIKQNLAAGKAEVRVCADKMDVLRSNAIEKKSVMDDNFTALKNVDHDLTINLNVISNNSIAKRVDKIKQSSANIESLFSSKPAENKSRIS